MTDDGCSIIFVRVCEYYLRSPREPFTNIETFELLVSMNVYYRSLNSLCVFEDFLCGFEDFFLLIDN